MAAKTFIEQYMECMDSLPLDVQKLVSEYKEMDYKMRDILTEAQSKARSGQSLGGVNERINWLLWLQRLLVSLKESGTERLNITSEMLDTAEGYSQKLQLAEKEVDNCRTRDDLNGTARNSSLSHLYKTSVAAFGEYTEKKKTDRHTKRTRTVHELSIDEDSLSSIQTALENDTKDVPVAMVTATPPSSTVKPPKKKAKIKKKSSNATSSASVKEIVPLLPVGVAIPQPDFNSEPIDPDEPTYCLCNQVSFGEMIGCDNDECPIEWFHFVCVNLTSKPKGKWYCPQCVKERAKHKNK